MLATQPLDAPSAQLHNELRQSVQSALSTRRPLLHHLNADSTWFLQIPRPASAVRNRASRFYYNILIDPWLSGSQSDVASWFSQQSHAEESAVGSIAELEELARESERLARYFGGEARRKKDLDENEDEDGGDIYDTLIDCVAISHEFTDHCHRDTLLQVHRDVPVFAIKEAARLISSWKHFRIVSSVPPFASDWRSSSLPPLPDWIGISRLVDPGDALNYHAALLIAWNNGLPSSQDPPATINSKPKSSSTRSTRARPPTPSSPTECLLYAPHGTAPGPFYPLLTATPPLTPLALLHGLHHIKVGSFFNRTALQSNLGAHNGLAVQRVVRARYWVGTHDEVKEGLGLVGWFIRRWEITLAEAVKGEVLGKGEIGGKGGEAEEVVGAQGGVWEGVNWYEVGNGGSRVLE